LSSGLVGVWCVVVWLLSRWRGVSAAFVALAGVLVMG